jgi:hypothetical protein
MPNSTIALVKLALLIDGDNVRSSSISEILEKAGTVGTVTTRRIYGQFSADKMKSWTRQIAEFDLTKVDVVPARSGKNATDIKMATEAMDMVHNGRFDGFCIASSDSDFTPLANRLRGSAVPVYAFAEKTMPKAYTDAFDRFFAIGSKEQKKQRIAKSKAVATKGKRLTAHDVATPSKIAPAITARTTTTEPSAKDPPRPAPQPRRTTQAAPATGTASVARRDVPQNVADAVLKIVRAHSGNATFRDIGNELLRDIPKFKAKAYGFGTTKAMLKALDGKHGLQITKDGQVVLALS